MIELIGINQLKKSMQGDVDSIFHFSFADYYDPKNNGYSHLRVMNDDIINLGVGFPMHPHRNMEIVSFCIAGELTHGDNMGNQETLYRGDIQYMSAGSGIFHSEFNNADIPGRFLQIWILPDKTGYSPAYGSRRFKESDRKNRLLKIVADKNGEAPVKINQKAEIYISESDKGHNETLNLKRKDKTYFKVMEGTVKVNGILINEKEAAKIEKEEKIFIESEKDSLYMIIRMWD